MSTKHLPCEYKDPSLDLQDLWKKLGMIAPASNSSAVAVEAGFLKLTGLKCQPLGDPDSQEGRKSLRKDTQGYPLSSVPLQSFLPLLTHRNNPKTSV